MEWEPWKSQMPPLTLLGVSVWCRQSGVQDMFQGSSSAFASLQVWLAILLCISVLFVLSSVCSGVSIFMPCPGFSCRFLFIFCFLLHFPHSADVFIVYYAVSQYSGVVCWVSGVVSSFYRAGSYASAVFGVVIRSVCPSVTHMLYDKSKLWTAAI